MSDVIEIFGSGGLVAPGKYPELTVQNLIDLLVALPEEDKGKLVTSTVGGCGSGLYGVIRHNDSIEIWGV